MTALLFRNCGQLNKLLFTPSFPTTSQTSIRIFLQYGRLNNFGTFSTRQLLLKNNKRLEWILRKRRFLTNFFIGATRSFRLIGLSFGLCWPQLIRFARCRGKATTRTGHQQNEQKYLFSTPAVSWSEFWALIRPYFGWLIFAAVSAAIVAALNIQIPILLGQLVNQISAFLTRQNQENDQNAINLMELRPAALKLILTYFGQAFATFLCITSLSWMGERMSADLRVRLFSHLLNFPMPFFDAQRSGELSDRLNLDVQEFKSSFKNCTIQGLRTIAQTIGCCISLYLMSPQMTILTVGILPAIVVVGALFGRLLRKLSLHAQMQRAIAAGVAAEAFQNVRTVKVFSMEEAESRLYHEEVQKACSLNEKLGLGIGSFQAVSNLFLNGLVLAVLYGGGQMIAAQAITPGDLMSFLATAQTIQRSLAQLSLVFDNWVKTWASCAQIMEFLRFEPGYGRGGSQRIAWHTLAGRIQFKDVHFAYPTRPGHPILRGLNLEIGAGQTVAICGPSGAGKSTVAAIIERLYEPESGQVILDGFNLRHLDQKWLRQSAIGVISQEPVLFSTSIRENIRYGQPDATEKEIKEAAELANADQFIEQFPQGYDTLVGERGVTLSGGQKQRIAIARALIKNPPILLLDEATSALDNESERMVQQALGRIMSGRSVIIIAHRLSTIRNADQIFVLKDGRVAEQGTHNKLIRKKNGIYQALVNEEQKIGGK